MMLSQIFFLLALFIIGSAIGSFISVLIYRLHHREESILRGRSHCPDCKRKLSPLDLIPLVSYLTLRGKCRYCNKEISYMYPLLEIISGFLFAVLFLKFPFFDEALNFSGEMLGLYLLFSYYAFTLIFTFFFDLRYLKVADEILLPAILIGFIATLGAPATPHFIDALIGAAIPIAFFGLQILASRGTWMGLGDLRVGAFMGVILGWKLVIVALFLAYLIGSLVSLVIIIRRKKFTGVKIPFAPFLVLGTFAAMFYGEAIVGWYLNGMGF